MKSAYYIVYLKQVGNIGPHEIQKIKDQPEKGFVDELTAEKHMKRLSREGLSYPFHFKQNICSFAIMKLYRKK